MSRERDIHDFVKASNLIEGITREPYPQEIEMVTEFLGLSEIMIVDLENAVNVFEPGEKIRDQYGWNVSIGRYVAPSGGPRIKDKLMELLWRVNGLEDIYTVHCDFECLHPFTDGNGRAGRLLWLWMMMKRDGDMPGPSFLEMFYRQALAAHRYQP